LYSILLLSKSLHIVQNCSKTVAHSEALLGFFGGSFSGVLALVAHRSGFEQPVDTAPELRWDSLATCWEGTR